jgi:hypothetical protein
MSDYDVQEIEVPGYIGDLDGEVQTMQAVIAPRNLDLLNVVITHWQGDSGRVERRGIRRGERLLGSRYRSQGATT